MRRLLLSLTLLAACTPSKSLEPVTVVAPVPALAPVSAAPTASAVPPVQVDVAVTKAPAPVDGASLPRTHAKVECNAGERQFFACSAKEGASARRIVVCGADLGKPTASLSLVYGDATRAEDELRALIADDGTLIRYARYTRPLVTYLHLEMKRGQEVWDISDDASDEGPRPERISDLVIRAPGKSERSLRCVARSRESLMGLEDHLQKTEPWF